MKTTVFCVTIFCLELASSFPFPEQLPSYYGSYEPVSAPEQRIIHQPIQSSNLARSQNSDLSYQQQQLAYPQQENERRQNYENLLRKQEQQQQATALKQRLANQLSIPSQTEHNYSPIPLNAVHDPYLNSVSLQRPIQQPQYEAPIKQQYYQNQQINEPFQRVEPPQQYNVPNPEPQPVAGSSPAQPNYSYNQKYQPVQNNNARNVLYDPRIQQALASSPIKKRYLVIHPNGTIEHIDKIEHIVKRHPNYILVNAGDLPQPNVTPAPVNPRPGNSPAAWAESWAGPVHPVAPLTSVVSPTPSSPVIPPTPPEVPPPAQLTALPAPPGALPLPTILNGSVPSPKPTVEPPTGPTTTPKSVIAPTAAPPRPTPQQHGLSHRPGNSPAAWAESWARPVHPVAPLTPVVSPTPSSPVIPPTPSEVPPPAQLTALPAPPGALPLPPILNGRVPGPKTTVEPPTSPTTTPKSVIAPKAAPPRPTPQQHGLSHRPGNSPAASAESWAGPVHPVAPLTPVVSPTPSSPVIPPTPSEIPPPAQLTALPAPPGALPLPPILNSRVPGPKPTVEPTTGPTTTPKSVIAPTAAPPRPTTVTTGNATVTPPSVVTATAVYPPPGDTTCTTPATAVTTDPTATTPSTVTATATAVYPPLSDLKTTTPTPAETAADPTATPPSAVNVTATAVYPPDTDPVTPTPVVNATATSIQSPKAITATNADTTPSEDNEFDEIANATVSEQAGPTTLDLPFEPPTDSVVWFRTTDLNFWDKITSGNETFDVVYFFNVRRAPRVLKDTKTVIYANGTIVEEVTQTIYDDEDSPPRVIKTTKVTNPDETHPKT